jgi:glycosyltransferase involved in cell wall biosynthesis
MKIAIVHDWLTKYSGAERVLGQMLKCFPEADLFSVIDFLDSEQRKHIQNKFAITTFIQKLPFARTRYQNYLLLMPLAIEQLDLSSYDLIISSSHAVAKGIIVGPDQLHISYIHSPMRYAWDLQHEYLKQAQLTRGIKSWMARLILHKMRIWDLRTSNSVDIFLANSKYIARRIWKIYRRKALVIYPPVDIDAYTLNEKKDDFYLTVSRVVPYKRVGLIIKAFSKMRDKHLVVIGEGSKGHKIRKLATPNVTLLGSQPFPVLLDYMQRAKAFVFAAEEDFGISPVEAQACGTPVLAYGKGGCLETICGLEHEKPTGMFFKEQTVESIIDIVNKFENNPQVITSFNCRQNAFRFSIENFRHNFINFVNRRVTEFSSNKYM